jgi:enoyl-CoA hydratase/carnithine racemase
MSDPVLIERTGDIVIWTLNDPEARNPISETETIEALENAVDAVNRDLGVRVAIRCRIGLLLRGKRQAHA